MMRKPTSGGIAETIMSHLGFYQIRSCLSQCMQEVLTSACSSFLYSIQQPKEERLRKLRILGYSKEEFANSLYWS